MKVPRDVDASELITLLKRHGYSVIRQTGSHIRLSKIINSKEHAITVPNHKPIKIGVIQNIAKDVCSANGLEINAFYQKL
ncbi:MAG: type II toxin-antitoxin system HicA family toxin [Defluviitaleaceae bacterium]|nr:type II toxin-antitoxin system HicA family toxin [Defluviitaleaceae bacterium]